MNNIEILEEFIEKNIKSRLRTELNANELQAIENLIQENKDLKNKCNELNFKYTAQWVDDNFIAKSKLKEKIEELERQKETVIDEVNFKAFYRITDLKNVEIGILKQLLEEGE